MMYCIGRHYSQLMPTANRPQRTSEMLAALVACQAGYMAPADIDAAVGVPKRPDCSGLALAKRMRLLAPITPNVPLYKPTELGETVLRFLDAEVV